MQFTPPPPPPHNSAYRKVGVFFVAAALTVFLFGCANLTSSQKKSAAAGAATGGILCILSGRAPEECLVAAAAGAIVGLAVGEVVNKIKESYKERNNRVEEIETESGFDIQTQTISTLSGKEQKQFEKDVKGLGEEETTKAYQAHAAYKATVPSDFPSGSARMSSAARRVYQALAREYKKGGARQILIVGHADSTGPAGANQLLSEKRALAVTRIFREQGFPADQLHYQGAGESEPIATNTTPEGRARNRRVDVADASKVSDLAVVKRISVQESQVKIAEVQSTPDTAAPSAPPQPQTAPVAPSMWAGANSILPFNGQPYQGELLLASGVRGGRSKETGGWFSPAHASDGQQSIPSFLDDEMKVAGEIKRYDGGDVDIFKKPSEHWPGYYKLAPRARVGDGLFALLPLSVLPEKNLAHHSPVMEVYKEVHATAEVDQNLQGVADTYLGDKNVLFRWKADEDSVRRSGILGMDILLAEFKKKHHGKTLPLQSQVYYLKQGEPFTAKLDVDVVVSIVEKDRESIWDTIKKSIPLGGE